MSLSSSCSRSLRDSMLAIACASSAECVEQLTRSNSRAHASVSRGRHTTCTLRSEGGEQLMRGLKVFCGAAALVAFLAPGAHADEWNKRTYLTFSGPVQIPGATLPAGTYTFEIA